ncbi:MAG: LysR family transcriptional regulator [Clostridiales bacterium]
MMTIQNMKYIIEIANSRSFSNAAKTLFLSQSTLSTAVKEVEKDLGIILFHRTSRGVSLTYDGEDFIRYAREIVELSQYLENRYQSRNSPPMRLSISSQHLSFAVRAFTELLKTLDFNSYDIAMRECNTDNVIHDVVTNRSEIGILSISDTHLRNMEKLISSYNLTFNELTILQSFVFIRAGHPLAEKSRISLNELEPYPFVTYDQEKETSHFTEEPLFYNLLSKNIHVSDRCTKIALIRKTNCFSIGPDLTNSNADSFHKGIGEIRTIPLCDEINHLHIGYILKKDKTFHNSIKDYIDLLITDLSLIAKSSPV